jgi:hypothetical protein
MSKRNQNTTEKSATLREALTVLLTIQEQLAGNVCSRHVL